MYFFGKHFQSEIILEASFWRLEYLGNNSEYSQKYYICCLKLNHVRYFSSYCYIWMFFNSPFTVPYGSLLRCTAAALHCTVMCPTEQYCNVLHCTLLNTAIKLDTLVRCIMVASWAVTGLFLCNQLEPVGFLVLGPLPKKFKYKKNTSWGGAGSMLVLLNPSPLLQSFLSQTSTKTCSAVDIGRVWRQSLLPATM